MSNKKISGSVADKLPKPGAENAKIMTIFTPEKANRIADIDANVTTQDLLAKNAAKAGIATDKIRDYNVLAEMLNYRIQQTNAK